jgi:citronellol/citronellal dehydrogenase
MSPYRSIFAPGLLRGQIALVTGGGSGIGRCTAHELATLGAAVAIVGRKADKLAAVQNEIEGAGGTCSIHVCDIREEPQVQSTVAAVLARHGRIDALVNNAGGQFQAPLSAISAKGWDAVVRNNLTGGFLFARECVGQWMLKEAGASGGGRQPNGGAVVNIIADMWGGMPGMGHSGAARAGMLNFTETAALEWAPVRVNAVAPGWIASSGMDTYGGAMRSMIPKLKRHVPMRRLGLEAEVSAAIVFLLSPAAAFITGVTLQIDGGASLGSAIFPTAEHARSVPFDGFHRAVTPAVLREGEDG